MLLDEKINDLQNLTKQRITYAQVAEILGLGSAQAAQNWVYRKRHLKEWELVALDEAFLKTVKNIKMKDINIKKLRFDYDLSQEELGLKLGITKQQVGRIESGKSGLTDENRQKLLTLFPDLQSNTDHQNNYISVDYYPEVLASCGNGTFEMSQECVQYQVPSTLFPPSANVKGYSMCHAKGNSMYPRIWDGDFVILEHKDNMKIENGEMYIFCYDDQLYLKRLTKNINQIVVESENPEFPTQYIEREEMNNLHIIGHVICSGRMNGKYMDKRV